MSNATITEILEAFEVFDGTYKRAQVDAALERQAEITPHLIRVLEDVLSNPHVYATNSKYYAHIYALVLLGHFKESRAHPVIVELFSLPPDLPHQLFGDLVTETLPIVLLRTCNGSMDRIKSLALNKQAYDYCRGSALKAMVFAVADGMVPREEVLAFFGSLFTGDEAHPHSSFWSQLAGCVYELYPQELMRVIEKAYQDGLIAPGYIGYADFERALKGSKEQALNRVKEEIRRRSPDNVHDYMSWWACFKQKPKSSKQAKRKRRRRRRKRRR